MRRFLPFFRLESKMPVTTEINLIAQKWFKRLPFRFFDETFGIIKNFWVDFCRNFHLMWTENDHFLAFYQKCFIQYSHISARCALPQIVRNTTKLLLVKIHANVQRFTVEIHMYLLIIWKAYCFLQKGFNYAFLEEMRWTLNDSSQTMTFEHKFLLLYGLI